MKPHELEPLVGRTVEVYLDGLRCAKVKAAPARDVLAVQLAGTYGRKRVPLSSVRGVYWRKRLESVPEFLARRAGGVA